MLNHILLEVYCLKDTDENKPKEPPVYCSASERVPRYGCLLNKCPFLEFTSHENALCYVNENSEAESIVSFGEELTAEEAALWKQISEKKMDEAYEEFVHRIPRLTGT